MAVSDANLIFEGGKGLKDERAEESEGFAGGFGEAASGGEEGQASEIKVEVMEGADLAEQAGEFGSDGFGFEETAFVAGVEDTKGRMSG